MKIIPFNIEKAKSGKYKIQTEDGKPVRIICWDKKTKYDTNLVGLVDFGNFETPICINESDSSLVLVDESTPNIRQRIFDIIIETCSDQPNLLPPLTPLSAVLLADSIQENLNLPKWKRIHTGEKLPETSLVMDKEGKVYGLPIEKGTKLADDFWYFPIKEIEKLDYEI